LGPAEWQTEGAISAVPMNIKSRKPSSRDPVMGFRPEPPLRAAIVRWSESQSWKPTLSEAIGHLVELGLKMEARGLHIGEVREDRARKMAGDTIDDMSDVAATSTDRANRKRDLLNGPEEFRRVRVDRPTSGTNPQSYRGRNVKK
jgi:hypothetical protein